MMSLRIPRHFRATLLAWSSLLLAACGDAPANESQASSGETTGSGGYGGADTISLTSPELSDLGDLPAEHTCDGPGTSPPLAWDLIPDGAVELALMMTTEAPDGLKWNWVLYHLPASAGAIAAGEIGVGTTGVTSDGPQLAYAPPCSQGPGAKTYTFALYALSAVPTFSVPESAVSGAVLTEAIREITLATGHLSVSYTRPDSQ